MNWLVIGFGNELAADDGFGLAFAEYFLRSPERPQNCQVLRVPQLYPEHADMMESVDGVIFVDASFLAAPGLVRFELIDPSGFAANLEARAVFGHYLNPMDLLALCQTLYGRSPSAWLCTVGLSSTMLGTGITEFLSPLLPVAKDLILNTITQFEPAISRSCEVIPC